MPSYDYKCFACEHVFEEFQKISDNPIEICPKCGKKEVKRLVSATSFHLKGGGWYSSGYSSAKAATESSSHSCCSGSSCSHTAAKKEEPAIKEVSKPKSDTE